jgi:hypothetical protein
MAFLPCDRGLHPNPRGRNEIVYSAYGDGGDFSRFRLRLCHTHALEVYDRLTPFLVQADDLASEDIERPTTCITCGEPLVQAGWQVFVTCYPTQNDRVDYWALLHTDCRFPDWLLNTGANGHITREAGDKQYPRQGQNRK